MPHAHRLRNVPKNNGASATPPVVGRLTEERIHLLEQHSTLENLGHREWSFCRCGVAKQLQGMRGR